MATTLDLSSFHLSYDDEFNSFKSSPDGSSGYQTSFYFGGRSLPSNGEQEFYSDSTVGVNPFSLQNGQLTITASPGGNPDGLAYNSGLITTEGMFSQTYGYFEIRAELPQGQGMWPAFWLLPTDKSWPPEIDVLEAFGADNGRGEGGANEVHVGAITSNWASGGGGDWVAMPNGVNNQTGYHTYGVDWEPDHVTYYIDGQQVYQVTTPSDMNKPMYMLANLAVGGSWVGSPAGETGQYNIDYIRAYSKDPNVGTVGMQTVSSPDGANTGTGVTAGTPTPPPGDTGTGSSTVTVRVAEDAFNGDAKFNVFVDGQQVGGTQTATASHAQGQWQDVTLNGTFGSGPHTVSVNFINDDWGGTTTTDRNLYVQSVTVNGETISHGVDGATNGMAAPSDGSALLAVNGAVTYAATGTVTTPPVTTTPDPVTNPGTPVMTSALSVRVAEDAYKGDAQFHVFVDGQQVGGTYTTTASHAAGQWQDIDLSGTYSAGPHTIGVQFINDDWGGTTTTDRNLYVQSVTINGETISHGVDGAANGMAAPSDGSALLAVNGAVTYAATGTSTTPPVTTTPDPVTTPSGTGLSVQVSEDAYKGDAQFHVLVDGQQVGGTYTTTASHAAGQWQTIDLGGTYSAGPHTVGVQFVNDDWGGTTTTDRNLYVQSVTINGETISHGVDGATNGMPTPSDGSALLAVNGMVTYAATGTSTGTDTATGTGTTSALSTIVLHVSEDAYRGDAQFNVLVDGHQVGGTYTATASHSLGQSQDVTLTGDFGSTGPGTVDVQFINDAWGGTASTDRNLYVQSIDVNGQHFAGATALNNASNGAIDPNAAVMQTNGTVEFNVNHTAPTDWHLA